MRAESSAGELLSPRALIPLFLLGRFWGGCTLGAPRLSGLGCNAGRTDGCGSYACDGSAGCGGNACGGSEALDCAPSAACPAALRLRAAQTPDRASPTPRARTARGAPHRGGNSWGELGQGDTAHRGTSASDLGDALPYVNLGSGARTLQVAVGGFHSCALLEPAESGAKATAKCWGANEWGQLGYGDTFTRGRTGPDKNGRGGSMGDRLPAIELAPAGSDDEPVELSAGKHFSCARLAPSGSVKCWGGNIYEQLGHGSGEEDVGTLPGEMGGALPAVSGLERADMLVSSATGYFSCARPSATAAAGAVVAGKDGGGRPSVASLLRCWPAPDGLPPHGGDAYERYNSRKNEGNYGEEHRRFKHHGPSETQLLGKQPQSQALSIGGGASGPEGAAAAIAAIAAEHNRASSAAHGRDADGSESAAHGPRVSMLALSMGSVCAVVEPGGELHCYGNNHEGQLGRGDTRPEPLPPQGEAKALELSTSCASLVHDAPPAFDVAVRAESAPGGLRSPFALGAGAGRQWTSARLCAVLGVGAMAALVGLAAFRSGRARRRRRAAAAPSLGSELL